LTPSSPRRSPHQRGQDALPPRSWRQIAAALNDRGVTTARGDQWTAMQVRRVLDRL
jgi:hypothetical protein